MMKRVLLLTSLLVILAFSGMAMASDSFLDLKGHWSESFVMELVKDEIFTGFPDGTFRPNEPTSVSQFTVLVLRTQNIPIQRTDGVWYEGAVYTATDKGIIVPGEFTDYTRPITRGEMARMIVRAINEQPSSGATAFHDDAQIPTNVKGYVKRAYELGIIGGFPDGTFGANRNATRAEASVMLTKMRDESKREVVKIPEVKPEPPKKELPKTPEGVMSIAEHYALEDKVIATVTLKDGILKGYLPPLPSNKYYYNLAYTGINSFGERYSILFFEKAGQHFSADISGDQLGVLRIVIYNDIVGGFYGGSHLRIPGLVTERIHSY